MPTVKSQTFSLVLHVATLAILLFLTSRSLQPPTPVAPRDAARVIQFPRMLVTTMVHQRAGGSNQTALPARRGSPPPKAHRTFILPASQPDPKLPMPMTVAFESPTIEIDASQIGDPFSRFSSGMFGSKGRNGIGDTGCCGGIGSSQLGRPGISTRSGHPISAPQLIYKVEPEFSEEARKAKYQGMVVLAIEVDVNGHARNLRVIQGLGLGLDEKAVNAVTQWRFRPGYQDGKPVTTMATVEVNFRLL